MSTPKVIAKSVNKFPDTVDCGGKRYYKVEDQQVIEDDPKKPMITRGPFYALPAEGPHQVFMPDAGFVEYKRGPVAMHRIQNPPKDIDATAKVIARAKALEHPAEATKKPTGPKLKIIPSPLHFTEKQRTIVPQPATKQALPAKVLDARKLSSVVPPAKGAEALALGAAKPKTETITADVQADAKS